MTPTDKAERAKRILEDEVMRAAFNDIRMGLVGKLETCPLSDVETQHEIALMLQLLKRLREQLQTYVQGGVLEQHKAREDSFIKKMKQRLA